MPRSRSRRKRVSSAASDSPEGISCSSSRISARCSSSSHVRGGLLVRRDRLAHLLAVALRRFLELGRVDLRPEDVAEPLAERERSARAGRERHVVRHRRPEANGCDVRAVARVVEHADDPGRPFVARPLQAELLDQLRVRRAAGHGRRTRCGTSASNEPSVTIISTPSSRARSTIIVENVRQRRFGSIPSSRIASRSSPGNRRVVEGVLGPFDPAVSARRRARRAAVSPGSRRSPPARSRRSAPPPRSSRGSRLRARRPGHRRSSRERRRSEPARAARAGRRCGVPQRSAQFTFGRQNRVASATVPIQTVAARKT